jgi:hypothetical protein
MGRWGLVAWLGIATCGCGDTRRNGGPEGDAPDGAVSANGATTSGTGGSGAGGQASGSGGAPVTTASGGVSGAAGSGVASECIAASGDPTDLDGREYLLEQFTLSGTSLSERMHLRFASNSTAVLTSDWGTAEMLDVERGTCASADRIEIGVGQYELRGAILLYAADGSQRLALSEAFDGGVGEDAYLNQPVPCYGSRLMYTTVRPDASGTAARMEMRFNDLIPWEPITFSTSKPPEVPLAESIVIHAGTEAIEVEVEGDNQVSMPDWAILFGATLEISADIVSTNGADSPFYVEPTVADPEPSQSPLEFATDEVMGLASLGEGATFLPPGDETCAEGCLDIGSNGGVAFALTGVQATNLVVRYSGGIVEAGFGMLVSTTPAALSLAIPGSTPETHSLPGVAESTATEFTLPREISTDDVVYGLITGAYGSVQVQPGDGCNLSGAGASVYLEGVELVE